MEKRVLWIEHDEDFIKLLQGKIGFLANRRGLVVDVIAARHMEEAGRLLSGGEFDVIFLEIIVPKNAESVERLKELDARRQGLLQQLTEITRSNSDVDYFGEEVRRLREEIDRLDDEEIEPLLNREGGCEILEELARKSGGRLKTPVLVFTVRSESGLKERCQRAVYPDCLVWLNKFTSSSAEVVMNLFRFLLAERAQ